MAIIDARGNPFEPLMQMLMAREQMQARRDQLALQEQDLALRKDALKIQQQEAEAAEQARLAQQVNAQADISTFLNRVGQGDPVAQAAIQQLPTLQGSLGIQATARSLGMPTPPAHGAAVATATRPTPSTPSRLEEAEAGAAQAQAVAQRTRARQDALAALEREARVTNDPSLLSRAQIALHLEDSGLDATTARELLPPTMRLRLEIQEAQDAEQADTVATAWLQRQGLVPPGASRIPGAGDTMLRVLEGREGQQVDWMQEGLDFITARVGDSESGSPFAVAADGSLSLNTEQGAVEVDQAISEWRQIVTKYAPEPVRERIIAQLESTAFTRRATINAAAHDAARIIGAAADRRAAIAEIRELLGEEMSSTEITAVLREAERIRTTGS